MSETRIPSISGSWYGNYYHDASAIPHGFEAVFVEDAGVLTGSILDNSALGEAHVAGTFTCPRIHFVKTYYGKHSVTYDGTLGDDGNTLSGTWRIPPLLKGNWIAWRVDDDEDLEEVETDVEDEVASEHLLVKVSR